MDRADSRDRHKVANRVRRRVARRDRDSARVARDNCLSQAQ